MEQLEQANRELEQDIAKRQIAEAALRESEERYRILVEMAPDAIAILSESPLFCVNYINRKGAAALGAEDPKELIGVPWKRVVHPEQWSATRERIERLLAGTPDVYPREDYYLRLDGTEVPAELTAAAINLHGQKAVQIIGRDITDRKQAEKGLLLTTALLEAQSETSIDGILAVNSNGEIILSNHRFREMWNVPPDMLATRNDQELLATIVGQLKAPHESLDKVKHLHAHPLEQSRDEIELKDGRVFDRYTSRLVLGDGAYAGRIWYSRDLTERKRAEEQLRESAERLRQMMEGAINSMISGVESRDPYTAGHQRRIAQLASAIAAEMGLAPDQIEGIRMAGHMHDLGKIAVPAEILSKPGKLSAFEFGMIKGHPQCGHDILREIDFIWPVALATLQHHERLDGSGYPQGLTGDRIAVEARILAVADVVEAVSSHRPYRAALGTEKALDEIQQKKAACYDPRVVEACVKLFKENRFEFE